MGVLRWDEDPGRDLHGPGRGVGGGVAYAIGYLIGLGLGYGVRFASAVLRRPVAPNLVPRDRVLTQADYDLEFWRIAERILVAELRDRTDS